MTISTYSKKAPVKDKLGRTFRTLRLSLTSSCNLACTYCVDGDYRPAKTDVLPATHFIQLIKEIHQISPLQTVRLTGGEPLLYKPIAELVAGLKGLGIKRISLTTNGALLERNLPALTQAGLNSINISLDAVEPEVYKKISRRNNLDQVLAGIAQAARTNLEVKLNATVMAGTNENQVLPLLDYARAQGVVLRYLELMNMGYLHGQKFDLYTQEQILEQISARGSLQRLPRKKSATANYWLTHQGQSFGIIANHSEPFCFDCDRLRIDSKGRIYGCLSSNEGLSPAENGSMSELLGRALGQKQTTRFQGSTLSMIDIGG